MSSRRGLRRLPLLAVAGTALLSGLLGGLARLGWTVPHAADLANMHAPVMVCGLFGTLIGVERAVAIGRPWSWAAPVLAAAGTLALLAGLPPVVAGTAWALAATAFAAGCVWIARADPGLPSGLLVLGASAWAVGCAHWLWTDYVPDAVGWWVSFLVLTILGERLEMSRLVAAHREGATRWTDALLLLGSGLLAAGSQNGPAELNGAVLFGLGLLACSVSLVWRDMAFVNIRKAGEVRFFAAAMLAGYAWLAVGGLVLAAEAVVTLPAAYEAGMHAVLIGFVLSMVFGHALVILPAVLGVRLRYHPMLYGPLALLHGSVALRVAGGLLEWHALRMASGLLTAAAILSFAASVAIVARRLREAPKFSMGHAPAE